MCCFTCIHAYIVGLVGVEFCSSKLWIHSWKYTFHGSRYSDLSDQDNHRCNHFIFNNGSIPFSFPGSHFSDNAQYQSPACVWLTCIRSKMKQLLDKLSTGESRLSLTSPASTEWSEDDEAMGQSCFYLRLWVIVPHVNEVWWRGWTSELHSTCVNGLKYHTCLCKPVYTYSSSLWTCIQTYDGFSCGVDLNEGCGEVCTLRMHC